MKDSKRVTFKISQRISDHLIEAILIFTSVFFAFWLTEYRESRNEAATIEISLQHVASEMKYNHKRAESIFRYHTNLIKEIDSLRQQDETAWKKLSGEDLSSWKGLQMPMLRSTAYQTFLNSNIIDNVEFELAKSLADIYNSQSIVERFDNSFFEVATTDTELSNLPKVRHLAKIYMGIIPELMSHYQLGKNRWFDKYGYDMEIENEKLKRIVDSRVNQLNIEK